MDTQWLKREIKFRAWNMLGKEMSPATSLANWIYTQPDFKIAHESNPYASENIVFMQFTGLKDKNGVEIYEGDIVKEEGTVYQIKFANGGFLVSKEGRGQDLRDHQECEVVGNVFENPELLAK